MRFFGKNRNGHNAPPTVRYDKSPARLAPHNWAGPVRSSPASSASMAAVALAAQPSHGLPATDLLRTPGSFAISSRGRRSVLHAGGSPHSRDHSRLEKRPEEAR